MVTPIPTAMMPTNSALRAPTMSIEKTSRPNWSVPSQLRSEGGRSRFMMRITPGS